MDSSLCRSLSGQADTTKLYNSLAKMYDFYLKCDEIEQAKVQSGELKNPKFRKKNADALKTLRLNLVNEKWRIESCRLTMKMTLPIW